DAPVVLGGRGSLLCAGIGAPLRAGDRIGAAAAPELATRVEPQPNGDRIRVIPGPDIDAFAPGAIDRLIAAPYRISSASDRVGTRLIGAALIPIHTVAPRPMVLGAIEVPPDGQPIVLGPEHPTTGGYPILAVIAHADLGLLFAVRIGGAVQL